MKNLKSRLHQGVVRTYTYVTGLCPVAALGNAITEYEAFYEAFGHAFWNQAKISFPVSAFYPIVFNQFSKTDNYRLYANLYQGALTLGFIAWHYFAGTENPVETVVPMAAVAFALGNKHVSEDLETKLNT